MFCHTCVRAFNLGQILNSRNASPAFVSKGFYDWKDATRCFRKHAQSDIHKQAVEAIITLPKVTKDVGESLSRAHGLEKMNARNMLAKIISGIMFLARQGLALRGEGNDEDSNLIQLLKMQGSDNPSILKWLSKENDRHTAHENQNEILEIMSHMVVRGVLTDISSSPFFAIMMDEATDKSNKEQLTLVIRWVSSNLQLSEEFLGLYSLDKSNAESISSALFDALIRFQIPLSKIRGQCYDGCSTMSGSRSGVAKRIQEREPRAVFTHCFGHALNLSVSDTIKKSSLLRDCLDTEYELVKLIKFSPKREAMLRNIKEENAVDAPNVRTLCPTRWTVRADALASIIANYEPLQDLWFEALKNTSDTDMKARIRGIESQMRGFQFLFALHLAQLILQHTDRLSATLQEPDLSAVEGYEIAMLSVKVLERIRSEENFDLFWDKVQIVRAKVGVDEASLPRRRKPNKRYEDGLAETEFPVDAKSMYRQHYYEALDLAVSSIKQRFMQPGYRIFSQIEQVFLKTCSGLDTIDEIDAVCDFFVDDFNKGELISELMIFHELYLQTIEKIDGKNTSIRLIRDVLLNLNPSTQGKLIRNVWRLFQLLLVLPATNATSERSFSALRRIKSYLRTTMSQARLNHLMILHYHRDRTDQLNVGHIGNAYISRNNARMSTFAKFTVT